MKPISWENEYDSYLSYMESEAWRNLRNKALEKDNYKCALCNSSYQLQVHHLFYPSILGTETVNDLITVCDSCHKLLETLKKGSPITVSKKEVSIRFLIHVDEKDESKTIMDNYEQDYNGFYTQAYISKDGKVSHCYLGHYNLKDIYKMKEKYKVTYYVNN